MCVCVCVLVDLCMQSDVNRCRFKGPILWSGHVTHNNAFSGSTDILQDLKELPIDRG